MTATQEMERALTAFIAAGLSLQKATRLERKCELEKPIKKAAAIRRLVGTANPATDKPHSASSAELAVESEVAYHVFRQGFTEIVIQRMEAECAYDVARFRADLAVARAKQEREEIGAAT